MSEFKSLSKYFHLDEYDKNYVFIVPNYQRGFKWSVKAIDKGKDSAVEKLLKDLLVAFTDAFTNNNEEDFFLQGITVVNKLTTKDGIEENQIILIDGQQRTTTLYFLLWCLDFEKLNEIKLRYDVREESKQFIANLNNGFDIDVNKKDSQDIFYFKQAIIQIKGVIANSILNDIKLRNKFINFILEKVLIIYIEIPEVKATKTFTMMNGSKASMLPEELAKAELLRRISISSSSNEESNIETYILRNRYAREWDKWLYWWNREDVKDYFDVVNPLGILLDFYLWTSSSKETTGFSFNEFTSLLNKESDNGTKIIFKKLRDLQKSFEDIFEDPVVHNYLKLSLICSKDSTDKFKIIEFYILNKSNKSSVIKAYTNYRLIGINHALIIEESQLPEQDNLFKTEAELILDDLSSDFVYNVFNDHAFKQLLRLNVEEDNKLKRKFDFSIWKNKSLEHIFPKSKFFNQSGDIYYNSENEILEFDNLRKEGLIDRGDFFNNGSEHCIGNLLLLYNKENSVFGAKSFSEKKNIYFDIHDIQRGSIFKSRHLLHTISVFSKEKWGVKEIQENKELFITRFKKDYNLKDIGNV